MPKGSQGQKMTLITSACAAHVANMATGQIEVTTHNTQCAKAGRMGAKVRSDSLAVWDRFEIVKKAANARWGTYA